MSYVNRLKKIEAENLDKETLDEAEAFARLLGYAIARTRQALGMSQKEIADAIGIQQSQFSKVETGKMSLTVYQLVRISRKLRCPLLGLIPPP